MARRVAELSTLLKKLLSFFLIVYGKIRYE
jgi:hypothetical protein